MELLKISFSTYVMWKLGTVGPTLHFVCKYRNNGRKTVLVLHENRISLRRIICLILGCRTNEYLYTFSKTMSIISFNLQKGFQRLTRHGCLYLIY